nr:MAG: hypothetical protein DIU64_12595 [Caldicoprobacter oshimai]
MKKTNIYIASIWIIPLSLFIVFCLYFYFLQANEGIYRFKRLFDIKLPKGTVWERLYDSHGGFHGDGESLYRYTFTVEGETEFLSYIAKDGTWSSLPLSDALNLLMYGGTAGNRNYSYRIAEEVGLPKITNGYWKVVNKQGHRDIDMKYLETTPSFNFALAIYDIDNKVLYMVEIDT